MRVRVGQRSIGLLVVLITAGVVLSVLHNTGAAAPMEDLALRVTGPVRGAFESFGSGIAAALGDMQRFGELRAENEELRSEVGELRAQVGRLARTEHENERLREALDYSSDRPELDLVTARVVGRDSLDVLETIVINRGTASGIRVGMAVVAQGGLAGRVTAVTDNSADVLPIDSSSSSVSVMTDNEGSEADGIVDGDGAGGLLMRRIEPDVQLSAGDFVVTSGLGGGFPRGIPVGRVVSTERPADSVFRLAKVAPLARSDRLDVIQVIVGRHGGA